MIRARVTREGARTRTGILEPLLAAVTLAIVVLSSACGSEPPSHDEPPRGDLFIPRDGPFRLSDEPTVVIAGSDTLPFDRVVGGVFLGDGIAVADSRYRRVFIFDAEGRFVSTQGRSGQGPGEYTTLGGVVRHGDGLVTWDQFDGRVTLLDSLGQYVSDTRVGLRTWRRTRVVGAFGNRALVEFSVFGFHGQGDVGPLKERTTVEYEMLNLLDGTTIVDTSLPGEERWVAREETRHGGLPVIFGRHAVAAVAGDRAYLATTDSLTLAVYDALGNREFVSFEHDAVTVEDHWEGVVRDTLLSYIEGAPERLRASGEHIMRLVRFRRDLFRDLPARSTLPSFSEIRGAADGRLWIREHSIPTQDHEVWVVLGEGWVPEQWVEIPADLDVLDLSRDRVLVRGRGHFGEHLVEVYAIQR